MEDINIPIELVLKNGLSINEYLVLYDIAHQYSISNLLDSVVPTVASLERKGFVKISGDKLFLRQKSEQIFSFKDDLFVQWLKAYPVKVKNRFGGKRALSPSSPNTILGRKLRQKWKKIFKSDVKAQKHAIAVLEADIAARTKSGELEYMVEAVRWLNEGYHEKYSFLLDEQEENNYTDEDYM